MPNDYEDPPIGTRQARVSTWVAVILALVVIGAIVWFAATHWTPDESYHPTPSGYVPSPGAAPAT